ncbi:protein translocase subunit SecF [Zongyangia hominis]|uniref:Protein-export membrane protein SecF n=1 Tax=Zongyangia hominis TaxID=2763677 RepID=A0A926EBV7_9FIRM|nr:protein translocase subunit SecF [Zongyangia hominis]MBC8569509.1 protein translocase subunit SecF [Zongyangia hominis]
MKHDFVSKNKIFYTISICLMALTLILTFVIGLNLDIQFKGGAIISYSYTGDVNANDVQSLAASTIGEKVNVQGKTDVATGKSTFDVSLAATKGLPVETIDKLTKALQEKYPDNAVTMTSSNNVDPTIGREFFAKCMVAVAFASLVMVVYIAFRFKRIGGWSAGVMCMLALLHDMVLVYATFIVCQFPINENFVVVILTILGYSINNTIVVYDRIRENKRLGGSKLSIRELVNKSLGQSITRAVNTTVSTVIALAVICIVAMLYGVNSILSFAFPMIIGMISGVYSSLFIAPTLWVVWQEHKINKKKAEPAKA